MATVLIAARRSSADGTNAAVPADVNAELFVKLVEEMTDLKLQQNADPNLKLNPEVTRLLQAKRETDRRRLEQIRQEMVRCLKS
jgi:hypothetical protein